MASSSQAQRIHSGLTNSQGGAVFNDDLHAARDININHITTIRPLARSLYRSCLTSSDLFKDIQNELAAFLSALETAQETCIEHNVDIANNPTLRHLSQSSNKVLRELQGLQTHFDSVGAQTQITWERMGWGAEEVADIRERLSSHIATLNLFNCNMINSSQRRIEQRLNMLIEEVRAGKREGSVISTQTIDSLSTDEREAWRQLRKELESVGITPALFSQHSLFIVTTLQRALIEEGLAGDVTLGDSHMTTESGQETLLLSHSIQSEATVPNVRLINTSVQQFSLPGMLSEKTLPALPDEMLNEADPKAAKKPTRMARILNKLLVSETKFEDAFLRGDAILAKQLLERGATPSSKNLSRALLHAGENGHVEVVKLLLTCSNVNADSEDFHGRTPLLWAVVRGHEAIVKLFLTHPDVNIDCKDVNGHTPLSLAAARGHEAIVKLFLTRPDVNVNSEDTLKRTPLLWAVACGHEAIVKLFLTHPDVNVDCKDVNSWTTLSLAAARGHEAVVKLFLTRPDVNVDYKDVNGRTPLSWAAAQGYKEVVKLFLTRSYINADFKDYGGRTPLSWAAAGGYQAVVKLFLTRSDVNADSEDVDCRTPLLWAALGRDRASKQVVRSPATILDYDIVINLLLTHFNINTDSEENFERAFLAWMAKKEDGKRMERWGKNIPFRYLSQRQIGGYELVIKAVLARFDS